MHTIYKITLFLSFLMITAFAFAGSEAEYKKISKAWSLHADGSQEYRFGMELTLFTHTAMNSTYGESFILYNPKYQKLKIHASYTKQVDGTLVETPENAFVEVLPRWAANAPAYNHLKEMVVVHTGLELGATIYLDYSIITQPGYYPALDIQERLQETSPVKEYTVSVSVPENTPLNRNLYASSVKATESRSNGTKKVQWTLRNIPASSRESFLPQNGEGIPCLLATTYNSQEEALSVLQKRLIQGLKLEAKGNAEYITENATTETEKAAIIQNHIVNNMSTTAIPLEQTGYATRCCDDVLRSAYGTLAEKTQLLAVMLQAVGIPCEIIAIYPANLKQEACGLKAIKGLALKATIEGKEHYLSAASLAPSTIPQRGSLDRLYTLSGEAFEVTTQPIVIKEKKAITLKADQAKNGYIVYTLPPHATEIDTWSINRLNSKRNNLFELPSLIDEEIIYTLHIEEGMKLQTPVESFTINKPFGSYSQTIQQEGNTIEVKRKIELKQLQYTPTAYKELRTLLIEWSQTNNILLQL